MIPIRISPFALLFFPGLLLCAPPSPSQEGPPDPETVVVDMAKTSGLDAILDGLAEKRVIFLGETHDRYAHHLNQLAVIRGLWARGKQFAIGMECFQQPFQDVLDAFIQGTIDEQTMLRRTQYFDRWRYDYRLYRPILAFAREQGIPVIALNIARELTDRVKAGGIESLDEDQRAQLPARKAQEDPAYLQRIRTIFQQHPKASEMDFDRFLAVQILWDESMAERGARYLREVPENALIILAGTGHLEYGQGIPSRLQRRLSVPSAILLNSPGRDPEPGLADYLLYPRPVSLPEAGHFGILLDTDSEGEGVAIQGFVENSGAEAAGLKEKDRIVRIDGVPIAGYEDIRLALLDGRPGQKVSVQVLRDPLFGSVERLEFEVELH